LFVFSFVRTQESSRPKKHDGRDRTGYHVPRAKITAELDDYIHNELYYYEKGKVEHVVFVPVLTLSYVRT
jgi:hypothetical protein